MPRTRLRSIQAQVVAVVLGAALVTALCAGIFVDQTRRNIEAQITKDQAAVAHIYAGLVDELLTSATAVSERFVSHPAMRGPLLADQIQPELKGLPETADPARRQLSTELLTAFPRISTIIMLTKTGDVYLTDPPDTQKTLPSANLSSREYFQSVVKTGKLYWSDVIIASTGAVVPYAMPVKDEKGALQGVVTT